jgi:uncharacterized protein YdhG (YjbR/CyaY superfamily)
MTDSPRATKRTSTTRSGKEGWTDAELTAMKDHAKELKAEARRSKTGSKGDGERDVLAKIEEMDGADRVMAERIHAIVRAAAPELSPRTWYGMPAYARDGKIVCFFTPAAKFKARFASFGFDEAANLDDGTMWPMSWALTDLTPASEAKIAELVKRAVR